MQTCEKQYPELLCDSCKTQKEDVAKAFKTFESTINSKFNTLIAELKQLRQLRIQKGI